MKCLAFSRAQLKARVFPSTGLYLVSDGVRNLLPQNINTHPYEQHAGVISLHSQVFCSNMNPIPFFDQSVAMLVFLLVANVLTPCLI